MTYESPFTPAERYQPASTDVYRDTGLPGVFTTAADEYRSACERAALFDRSDRGLITLTGADRAGWLHNLVTNAVASLKRNAGVYAFACDAKGRVCFDAGIFNVGDALWLDVQRRVRADFITHLDRRLIAEDVRVRDISESFAKLGCCGPMAPTIAAALGVGDLETMASLELRDVEDGVVRLVRNDFAGKMGFELFVPRDDAPAWWDRLVEQGAAPAGAQTLDVLRIEAGVPWLGRDLDDEATPLETGQAQRAIAFDKGCYLGQEVIERMRSRGVAARRLCKVTAVEAPTEPPPVPLECAGRRCGRLTSLVAHPSRDVWIGLAYVRNGLDPASGPVTAASAAISVGEPVEA